MRAGMRPRPGGANQTCRGHLHITYYLLSSLVFQTSGVKWNVVMDNMAMIYTNREQCMNFR